jgi:hypothetical protein
MPRERRFSSRVASVAAVGTAGVVAAWGLLEGACITTPPPALPSESPRPTILHDSTDPPTNEPLVVWPVEGQFSVPVELSDPDQSFCWVVFVDYNPYGINSTGTTGMQGLLNCGAASPTEVDGGVVVVPFTLDPSSFDLSSCHQIQFIVAQTFESDDHTPVFPPGGDDVIWNYVPGGGPQCPLYDAGAFADGAFPPADAPSDSNLLLTPPSLDSGAGSDDSSSP